MKLQRREMITVAAGGAIALAVLLWKLGAPALAGGGSIAPAIERLERFAGSRETLRRNSQSYGIEIPEVKPADQEALIRRELAQLAQRNGMQVASTRVAVVRGRGGASQLRPLDFSLELSGQFESFLKFVHALETSPYPFSVREFQIQSAAGGRGGSGGPGGPPGAPQQGGGRGGRGGGGDGSVRITLQVESQLFPEVIVNPEAEKKAAEARAAEAAGPPQGPTGAPGMPPGMAPGMAPPGSPAVSPSGPRIDGNAGERFRGMSPEDRQRLMRERIEQMRQTNPAAAARLEERMRQYSGGGR